MVDCFWGSLAGESPTAAAALGVGDLEEEEAGAAPPPIKSLTSLLTSSLSFAKGSGAAFGICQTQKKYRLKFTNHMATLRLHDLSDHEINTHH